MQVKICGLKDAEMMDVAVSAGADFVGLVFFEKSPRHVTLDQAIKLAEIARGRTKIVALVVDEQDAALEALATHLKPDYLQLHGSETPERCDEIAARFRIPLIKALGVRSIDDVARADLYSSPELILFDAKADPKVTALPGGNGIAFDWNLLHEQCEKRVFMLSGGLTPFNVQEAIRLTGATMVDTSSGVEREKGVKDPDLIRDFIKQASLPATNE